MATTTTNFSSDLLFSIFQRDLNQYSLGEIKDDDSKTFLWYQFMLDVLHDIPRSSADIENVITGVSRVNELGTNPPVDTNQKQIDEFRTSYTSDTVIYWYTRDSFLYRSLNIASRIRDGDAIVQFHPIVKDLDNQLKQLHLQQKENGRIKLPMTVYRGQAQWGVNEMEKLKMSEGSLISMNTFLSTTVNCSVATNYILSTDKNTSVLFQITINDTEESKQFQTYAHIDQYSAMGDEKEVLFSMSSVFRVTSVEEDDYFWVINLELTSCTADANVLKLMNEVKTYLYQVSNRQFPFTIFKQLLTKTSNDYTRSLTELMKFILNDMVHLFATTAYKKQGRIIELINEEPALKSLATNKTFDIVHSDQALICLLFDLFNKFLYDKNKNAQEKISFDMNDKVSLLCFGGFLLMTGDMDKGIRYFDMLQKNDSIDKKLRQTIGGIVRTIHVIAGEKELAMKYESIPLNLCESSTNSLTPSWFTRLMFSSSTTLYNSTEETNQIWNESSSIMMEKQSDNDIGEKTRLILLGNIN